MFIFSLVYQHKLLPEYNLLLTQKVIELSTGTRRTVTRKIQLRRDYKRASTRKTVLLCVAGTCFARSTYQLSCLPLSLPTQLLESNPAAYIENPAVLPLQN
jgi:hypothetical protein